VDLAPHADAIRADLETMAGTDDAAAAVAERLSRALESSLHLRLLDMVGQAALELSDLIPGGHVEVRLAGRDVELVYAPDATEPAPPADEESGTARITLRMPESLKSRVEATAAASGVSTNAWLVQAVTRGLEHRDARRRTGRRVTGFAQS
jgi:hypothetical protein